MPAPFGNRLLAEIEAAHPSQFGMLPPQWHNQVQETLNRITALAQAEPAPWPGVQSELREVVKRLRVHADRVALIDALGHGQLGPLEFVDDLTVPCASPGATRGVCSPEPHSACTLRRSRQISSM